MRRLLMILAIVLWPRVGAAASRAKPVPAPPRGPAWNLPASLVQLDRCPACTVELNDLAAIHARFTVRF